MKTDKKSLRRQIVKIVLFSMSILFLFQIFTVVVIMRDNMLRRLAAAEAAAVSIAASLDVIGQNIMGLGRYLSNYEAFMQLFLAERSIEENPAIFVAQAFNTIRYMTDHFPMIVDVVVVPIAGAPSAFYTGRGHEFLEVISQAYDFRDPANLESRFLYFEDIGYFAHVTPISRFVTPGVAAEKLAASIIIGDKNFIAGIIDGDSNFLSYGVFAEDGRLIASNAPYIWPYAHEEYFASIDVGSMGLTVRAFDSRPWAAEPGVLMFVSFIVFSLVILAAIIGLVIYLLNKEVARPISDLVREMGAWEGAALKTRLKNSNIQEIDQLLSGFNNMLGEIEQATRKVFNTQKELYETEIYALQNQINPHFLFNTLQCIRSIAIMEDVPQIAQIALSMSEIMRYSMHYQEEVAIREEIEIIRHYASICEIRFSGKFHFVIDFDPSVLEHSIGRMTLQPLVENAVMHGVSKLEAGGVVVIRGSLDEKSVFIKIEDNGPGIDEERLRGILADLALGFSETLQAGTDHSYGLYNINRRLRLLYGEGHGLNIGRDKGFTVITVNRPLLREMPKD